MNVVVEIQGREALPVWTLPHVTSWALSPSMLLTRLIKPDHQPSNSFPMAFNLGNQGQAEPIPPAQWVDIDNLISKLDNDLKITNLPEYDRSKRWKDRAIKEFWDYEPSYIWLDEFSAWYERFITSGCISGKAVNSSPCLNPNLPKEHAEYFMAHYAPIASCSIYHSHENPLVSKMLAETQNAVDEILNDEYELNDAQGSLSYQKEDPRLKYANVFGETISLSQLVQRWNANYKLINELCHAKQLSPYKDSREGVSYKINGSLVFVFLRLPVYTDDECIVEDVNDCLKYDELPEDVYFYWTEILSFEDAHPEIKERAEANAKSRPRQYGDHKPISNAAAKAVVEWVETLHNGQPIDWDYWKELNNITPAQAAKLAHKIDPILWPDDRYAVGKPRDYRYKGEKIDDELSLKIQRIEKQLETHSPKWSLVNLVNFLGEDNVPFGMKQVVLDSKDELIAKLEQSEVGQAKDGLKTEEEEEGVYIQRKTNFDKWRDTFTPNIDAMLVETIFEQVSLTDRNLWNIEFSAFQREFWHRYSKENGLGRKRGRPPGRRNRKKY